MEQVKHIKHTDEAGFTVLETSIAMVLLAIVALGIASCFVYAAKNNSSARDRELAMAVAQQQIEQYRNLKFSDPGMAATTNAGATAMVTRGGRSYQVVTTITDSNVQNGTSRTKTIQIRVVPWSDNNPWARTVTQLDLRSAVFSSVTIVAQRTSQIAGPNRAL